MNHRHQTDSTEELPPVLTEDTGIKLKASTVFKVGAVLVSIISTIVGFTIWLNTLHNDVAQLKTDVHELRVWLMPEHHAENPNDHRITQGPSPAP